MEGRQLASLISPGVNKAINYPHGNQVLGSEARPQNLEEKVGVLTLPAGNSYEGRVGMLGYQKERKRRASPGVVKSLENRVE